MGDRTAKDGAKFLKLCSPSGAPPALYKWPLVNNEYVNEAEEIVDTIRWVCHDFPDLKLAVENYILNDFDTTSYNSMKQLCDRYNKAITNIRRLWSGQQPPACIDAPPSPTLLRHIMNQVYNHAVDNPGLLNQYEPFSPEVYGETSYELIEEVIKEANISEDDVFLDLGSGVGNVVLQVAAAVGPKVCCGVEKADKPSRYAEEMEKHFAKWMKWYGKCYGEYELIKGDFLSPEFSERISSSTVIFVNNFAFGPALNHQLKLKFQNLPDGVRIISSAEFCPLNFRINDRNLGDVGAMMNVHLFSPLKGKVSWTNKPVSFYLQIIDRTLLEKYFYYKSHPEEEPPEELKRKLFPKEAMDHHSSDENEEEGKPICNGGKKTSGRETPTQVRQSAAARNHLVQQLAGKLARQVGGFLSQNQPDLKKQLAKEMAHRDNLRLIMSSLEEEVASLQKESSRQMGVCMDTLGLAPHTPQALLQGARSIENRNKVLKKEVGSVEGETFALQEQFTHLVHMMQNHGLSMPDDLSGDNGASTKVPSRPLKDNPRKMQLSGHRRTPSNGLETLLRVSELEFLRTDVSRDRNVERKDHSHLAKAAKAGVTGASVAPQSRDEVLAAETLSNMATLGVEPFGPSSLPDKHLQCQSITNSKSSAERTSLGGVDAAATSTIAPFVVAAPSHSALSQGRQAAASGEWNGMEAGCPIILQEDRDVEDSCVFTIQRVDTRRPHSSPADTSKQGENTAGEDISHSKSSQIGSSGVQVRSQTVTPPEYFPGHPILSSQRSLSASALATSSPTSVTGPRDAQLVRAPSSSRPDTARDRAMVADATGQPTTAPLMANVVGYGKEGEETGTLIIGPSSVPDVTIVSTLPTSAEVVEVASVSQPKPKQHRSRKRHSSEERQLPPGTKKSTVIHTDSSVDGYQSSATSSPALTTSNLDTPAAVPPLGLAPLAVKPGETPPLLPYLPMMAVAQKGTAVPMILPPSSMGPGYLIPPVSSVGGAQPSWPPFYWPVANTQFGQQQPSNSQMFSALDLQQPAQKQPGAPFVPTFLPSFMPPVGGSALTPTSLAPSFFPSHPFILPTQIPSAVDPSTISGSSTAGGSTSWKVPTTSSAAPGVGGGPGAAFPFPMMGMMQHMAMMKARGGNTGIHQPTTMPSSPGGLIGASPFPLHPPSTPGRGVPGMSLNQESSPSSGTASPSHPPAVFSPPFTVPPHMIPSMLLTGTMAPQVIQDVSRGGAGSLGIPSGAMNQNRSKQRYQRRRHKQPAQKADGTDGLSTVDSQSGSDTLEPPSSLSQPQPRKRSRGNKSATPRNNSKRPVGGDAVLRMCSIDEQRLQSLLSAIVRPGSRESTVSSQASASGNGQTTSAAGVKRDESKMTSEMTNTDSALSSDMDDTVNVTQTSTATSEGEQFEPMARPSSTATASNITKKSRTVTVASVSQFSRTRSPNSLAEASSLLALSQPITFGNEPQEQVGPPLSHTPTSGGQGDGPASSLKDGLQPESAPEGNVTTVKERENSRPCPSNETRPGRTPSLSAAEAMLMLTADFATGSGDPTPKDAQHVQEDEPRGSASLEDEPCEVVSLEGKEHSSSDVQGEKEEGKPMEESVECTLNDSESHVNPCDGDGNETRKEEVMDPSPLSRDDELSGGVLRPVITAPDEPTGPGCLAPLTLDTQPITSAEQSAVMTKLLSPPESSPSVTDCPPHDISEGLAALEAVSSEEEQIESHIIVDDEENKQIVVEVVGGLENNSLDDRNRRGKLSEPHKGESFHEKDLAEGEDGSLPSDPAVYTPGVTCNGQIHAVTSLKRRSLDEVGAAEVHDGANNPQLSPSEVAGLQQSAPATDGPIAAPVQLLTPPLDRDQVFTCALPEASDTVPHPQPAQFKHHDSTRKRRNYRHSSHKEHTSSKFNHRRSLSPANQRKDRDRRSTERSAFHYSGSEHRSSQHQTDPKTSSRDRSASRDWVQERPISVHEGQEYHQNYHPPRDSAKVNSAAKHRRHDSQWSPRHHERYPQQNGHHQTQPRSSQWDDRWKHSGTHHSSMRDAPREDVAGNSGYGHKRRHSSHSDHASSDPVPKPKRTVS